MSLMYQRPLIFLSFTLYVAGIHWGAKVLPVRVAGKCGAVLSDLLDGVRWAAGLPVAGVPANPNPARVINLSYGGSGVCGGAYQTTSAIEQMSSAIEQNADSARHTDSLAAQAASKMNGTVGSTGKKMPRMPKPRLSRASANSSQRVSAVCWGEDGRGASASSASAGS